MRRQINILVAVSEIEADQQTGPGTNTDREGDAK